MIDSTIISYGNDVGYGQHFESDMSRQNHNLMGAIDVHGTNLQTLEKLPAHQMTHTMQRSPAESFLLSINVSTGTQLSASDGFAQQELAYDSRLCSGDARPPEGTKKSIRVDSASRSRADDMSSLQGSVTRETTLSRTASGRNHFPTNSKSNDIHVGNRSSVSSAKPRGQVGGSATPEDRVKQLSKAIVSDVTKNINQVSPEELQLIIQTQILTLLGSNGSSKRTSDDAGLDNSTESLGKRVTCSVCPKMMGRPCDIK